LMASLPTQSFSTIVSNTIAGIQGRASKLINFSTGSTLRAIVEGFAGLFLWFQAMVLQVLQATRLSTSSGTDVDTFTADFMPILPGSQTAALPSGSPRLGAQAATGQVTFARFTAAPSTCFIPAASAVSATGVITNAGLSSAATVQTSDGSQSFVVIADTTYATYSSVLGGYTLASSVSSIIVPVEAILAGAGGNVQAGAISVMTSPVTGIDTVMNVATFTNGANQESDSALKQRFSAYILGLSRGDYYGLSASIKGAAVTVQWTLTELYNYDGSYRPGYFFVVADDGSGNPPPAFLTTITNAANAVRPLGIQCAVFAPVILTANVSMTLTTAFGYDHNTVVAQVAALIATNINSLGLGNELPWSLLASWAYSIPGVTIVSNVTLNGTGGDAASIVPTKKTQDGKNAISYATVKAGAITVS
jgi:phage-related baseplate assembly protein